MIKDKPVQQAQRLIESQSQAIDIENYSGCQSNNIGDCANLSLLNFHNKLAKCRLAN